MILDYRIFDPNPKAFRAFFKSRETDYLVQIDYVTDRDYYHFAFLPWPKDTTTRGKGREVYSTSFHILEKFISKNKVRIGFGVERYPDETHADVERKHLIYNTILTDISKKYPDFVSSYYDGMHWLEPLTS